MDRICTRCNKKFPATRDNFYEDKRTKDGLQAACKKCFNEYTRAYYQKNKIRIQKYKKEYRKIHAKQIKSARLNREYGLSLCEYEELFKQQNARCKICGEKVQLYIDHCHTTGSIRGLLCNNCNNGLGRFKDSAEILKEAIKYLEGVPWKP